MKTAIKVEDLLSMQVFFYRNLRRAIEDPTGPIDQTYRNAQRLKAEHGYPFLIDGCRVSEIELMLCAPFGTDYLPVSNYEGDFESPINEEK
jgi:hypothetical protein